MNVKRSYNPPLFDTIQAAVQGSPIEMNAILRHYERYMIALSLRPFRDQENGVRMTVDPEMLCRLQSSLMNKILKFKII